MKHKKVYIPGWFDTVENRVNYFGLDIWKEKINPNLEINTEYIIGHSFGASFALLNWSINKNTKLILTNPLIGKKSVFNWLWRWLRFIFCEGTAMNKKRSQSLFYIFNNLKLGCNLLKIDSEKIIKEIPKENIIVIRGKNDNFFCDDSTCNFLKKENIKVIEIDEVGHHWDNKMNDEVDKIVGR